MPALRRWVDLMKVTNTQGTERTLSHRGQDYNLLPGASVDVPMTKDEADALSAIFDISGTPEKPETPEKAKTFIPRKKDK